MMQVPSDVLTFDKRTATPALGLHTRSWDAEARFDLEDRWVVCMCKLRDIFSSVVMRL